MRKNKFSNYFAFSLVLALILGNFLFGLSPALALNPSVNQVKVPGSSTVYYLNFATHQRKAYINATSFLSYGNKWSSIRTISPEELAKWPEAKLFKLDGTDELYYINGATKVKMKDSQDIIDYHLENVLPLTVSSADLDQYKNADNYNDGGLTKDKGLSISKAFFNPENSGLLAAGTRDNEVMALTLSASSAGAANVKSISFKLDGVYETNLIDQIYLFNVNTNRAIDGYGSFNNTTRQAVFNVYHNDLVINAGGSVEIKVMLDLNALSNVDNQSFKCELTSAKDVEANLEASANYPLVGPQFHFVSASSIIGNLTASEESLADPSTRDMARITLSETSGREDVYVKQISFINNGSAGPRDLDTFKLKRDGTVVANATAMTGGLVIFPVSYLRIPAGGSVTLDLSANLGTEYTSGRSVNFDLQEVKALGKTYGLSLDVNLKNQTQSFNLP